MVSSDPPARDRSASAGTTALRAPHLPRPPRQARWWRALVALGAGALIVSWIVWYAQTPEDLPTQNTTVTATGVAGQELYVGMFTVPPGFDREIHISGVKVHTTASADLTVTPLLCRAGTIGVTTAPEQFCTSLDNPEGGTLTVGDSIVVGVLSETPALAEIDRIRIGFREGLRWGTKPAGQQGAVVSLAPTGS